MDCVDCHNTVGHPIAPTPEQAVDRAIAAAMVSHELPFVRRESVRLVKASYNSQEDAVRAIEDGSAELLQVTRQLHRPAGVEQERQRACRISIAATCFRR